MRFFSALRPSTLLTLHIILKTVAVCGGVLVIYTLAILLPNRAIKQDMRAFERTLEARSTLLGQSRIFAVALIKNPKNNEVARTRLISNLLAVHKAQMTKLDATNPFPSFGSRLVWNTERRSYVRTEVPSALNTLTARHRQFLADQKTWLDTVEHTQASDLPSFLTSSSSIRLLTEQTNILLTYRFWIEKNDRHISR